MVIQFPGLSKEERLSKEYERLMIALLDNLGEAGADLYDYEFAALEAILINAVFRGEIAE